MTKYIIYLQTATIQQILRKNNKKIPCQFLFRNIEAEIFLNYQILNIKEGTLCMLFTSHTW